MRLDHHRAARGKDAGIGLHIAAYTTNVVGDSSVVAPDRPHRHAGICLLSFLHLTYDATHHDRAVDVAVAGDGGIAEAIVQASAEFAEGASIRICSFIIYTVVNAAYTTDIHTVGGVDDNVGG